MQTGITYHHLQKYNIICLSNTNNMYQYHTGNKESIRTSAKLSSMVSKFETNKGKCKTQMMNRYVKGVLCKRIRSRSHDNFPYLFSATFVLHIYA